MTITLYYLSYCKNVLSLSDSVEAGAELALVILEAFFSGTSRPVTRKGRNEVEHSERSAELTG